MSATAQTVQIHAAASCCSQSGMPCLSHDSHVALMENRHADAPGGWPTFAPDYIAMRGDRPCYDAEALLEWFNEADGTYCAKCGEADQGQWEKERDPYGTGDSPDQWELKGSACCGARLVWPSGEEAGLYDIDVPW